MEDLLLTLEAALERFSDDTGIPATVAVAATLLLASLVLWLLFARGGRRPRVPPTGAPAAAPVKKDLGEITLEELAQYDGSDPAKPICVALRGTIYDVSRARHLYGPEGGYACFAGKDASRALAKMSMDPGDAVGDLTGLTQSELDSLAEWEVQYEFKYDVVGKLLTPGAALPAAAGGARDEAVTEPRQE